MAEMKTIGFMLNTYEEHGPKNIAGFETIESLRAGILKYCDEIGFPNLAPEVFSGFDDWVLSAKRKKNYAHCLNYGWGGVQVTELAVMIEVNNG